MSTLEHEHAAESHHLPPAQVAHQQRRAVQLFIVADAVFFACMLFTYFYLRSLNVNGGWIPDGGQTADAWLVWLVAGVVVLSALAYRSAEMGIAAGQRGRFQTGALLGVILVIAAIALMVYQAATWPILMSDGAYASVFIVMSYVLLVHLVMLLVVGIGIWNRGSQGKLDQNHTHATVVGYYWYWIALTAVLGGLTTFFVA